MIEKIKNGLKQYVSDWEEYLKLDDNVKKYIIDNNLKDLYLEDLFNRKSELLTRISNLESDATYPNPFMQEYALKLQKDKYAVDNLLLLTDDELLEKCHLLKNGIIVEGEYGLIIVKM